MSSVLTLEQKREVLRRHYRQCYKIELNPVLPDEKIESLYKDLQSLAASERRHLEGRPKLTLITNDRDD